MKAVMYHYVREYDAFLPHFKFLHIDDFVSQITYFKSEFNLVSKDAFLNAIHTKEPIENGLILTFDDGFKDHHDYVLPVLKEFGTFGIFYVPTFPYQFDRLLDVHRTHLLTGHCDSSELVSVLMECLNEADINTEHYEEFKAITYNSQTNEASTLLFKRFLNYFIEYDSRTRVLDTLMTQFLPNESELTQQFYMSPSELKTMHNEGMIIGSHTVNHPVMSRLSSADQAYEITHSFSVLTEILGEMPVKTFCFPYGGSHVFSDTTLSLLEDASCSFSFNVDPQDISKHDLEHKRQSLPRYDCNMFPYGQCRDIVK